jgi:hypothetical protein
MQAIQTQTFISAADSSSAKINLRITAKFLLAFFALTLILGELHEQVHINTGRIICGGYGPRDFNAWKTAADCANPSWSFLATLVGPLFSYLVIWAGAGLLIKAASAKYKALGFSLIFAPLPFARIFTAAMGGGDERVVLSNFLRDSLDAGTIKILAAILVTGVCLPPVLIAWRSIKNQFRLLYVAGFLVLPLIVLGIYVFKLLNGLLFAGFLSESAVLGTPLLIIVHLLLMVAILALSREWLFEINRTGESLN